MKYLVPIFTSFALATKLDIRQASNVLGDPISRAKRANQFGEELKAGNHERECVEEMCDVEEYLEANEIERSKGAKNSPRWEAMRYPCKLIDCNPQNTKACKNEWRKATCMCKDGWEGELCESDIDECALGVCQHATNCTNSLGSYECECEPGWTGPNCDTDIDECAENMCQNGAECSNSEGSFKCNCVAGWTGAFCEEDIDECQEDPCNENDVLDNGYRQFCVNTPGSFNCACNGGRAGDQCEEDYDECSSNPCGENKVCTNGDNGYSCGCPEAGCQLHDAFGYLTEEDFPEIEVEEYEYTNSNSTDYGYEEGNTFEDSMEFDEETGDDYGEVSLDEDDTNYEIVDLNESFDAYAQNDQQEIAYNDESSLQDDYYNSY